ncbi:MAG TPA: hypothetical protein VGN37_20840 [Actinocatenispora sp.]
MAFHQIEPVPDVRLAHFLDATSNHHIGGTTITTRYMTYPIRLRRPAAGSAVHAVYCGTCRQSVRVAVPSADRTVRRQRCWLAVTFVPVALFVAEVGYLVTRPHFHLGLALVLVLLVSLMVLLGPTLAALDRAQTAHGVTVVPRQPGKAHRRHSIRRPQRPNPGARRRFQAARAARRAASATRTAAPATAPVRGRVTVAAVFGVRVGMGRDAVLARLGEPARTVAGEVVPPDRTPPTGDAVRPAATQLLHYDGPLRGHHTTVTLAGGVVDRVEIAEPAGAVTRTGARGILIASDGIHAATPGHAYQALDACLGPMPRIDEARLRTEHEEMTRTWPTAAQAVDDALATVRRLVADLTADAARPDLTEFTVLPLPDRACVQVTAVFAPPAQATAYRVWRVAGGRWALARSTPRP